MQDENIFIFRKIQTTVIRLIQMTQKFISIIQEDNQSSDNPQTDVITLSLWADLNFPKAQLHVFECGLTFDAKRAI